MNIYQKLLLDPRWKTHNGKMLLAAIIALVLPCFVYAGMLSVWSASNSTGLGSILWYSSSSTLLFEIAACMVYEFLALLFSLPTLTSPFLFGGRGGASGTPLTGAPRPVPVRPTPHLTHSAAESLPIGEKRTTRFYRGKEISK